MRCAVPGGFVDWWSGNIADEAFELLLTWDAGDRLKLGTLRLGRLGLLAELKWLHSCHKNADTSRITRIVGQAIARAAWQRPLVDPEALLRVVQLRESTTRLEFVLDTNAMVEGVAHWLINAFADRCDLVVTAVSLRELQDLGERAFPKKVQGYDKFIEAIGARSTYLAANRLREQTAYVGVLWRELAMEDTALLLSRGGTSGSKSSESDTMLLRAVRRSILDRVNGLERFFVTGDVALARRATSELPNGSVVASRVRGFEVGRVYLPCWWWPGPDQGRGTAISAPRLIWELLAIADAVELVSSGSGTHGGWRIDAYDTELWPSDYSTPWVRIDSLPQGRRVGGDEALPGTSDALQVGAEAQAGCGGGATTATPSNEPRNGDGDAKNSAAAPDLWHPVPANRGSLDANLRITASMVLDTLWELAKRDTPTVRVPVSCRTNKEHYRHLATLLEAAEIASIDGEWALAGPARSTLAEAWRRDDLDAIFDLLRVWRPLDEWATSNDPPSRPSATIERARGLAATLGQGMRMGQKWLAGGMRPDATSIRAAILLVARNQPGGLRAMPVHSLLVDVFLKKLGVAPVRALKVWGALHDAGMFRDFEFRTGGTSSGKRTEEVVQLGKHGWSVKKIDLEAVEGYRDMVLRSSDLD